MNIRDKVVLITGASEGIGAECVRSFRARGGRIAMTARSEAKLAALAQEGEMVVPADLYSAQDRARLVSSVLSRFGRIDILVNVAGAGLYSQAWCSPDAETRQMFELNFFAPLDLVRRVAPSMQERRSGCIVNVGSIAGKVTLPWFTLYSASKYAICSLTDGLRMELAPEGIHVMAVCPGYVDTNFQSHVLGPGRVPPSVAGARIFRVSPRRCAEAIARGVEQSKRTLVVPRSGWIFVALARMFPRMVHSQLMRFYAQRGHA